MTPSRWILRWAHLVAPGACVLDLACGTGRHARFFAARGATVLAVDRDADALAALSVEPAVTLRRCDLEQGDWPLGDARFDAIVVTNYLHRPLFPALRAALAPGGVLLYETFASGQQAFGRPTNPDFLLQPGELPSLCAGLHVLAYEDGVIGQPPAARVQRIVALAVSAEEAAARQFALDIAIDGALDAARQSAGNGPGAGRARG